MESSHYLHASYRDLIRKDQGNVNDDSVSWEAFANLIYDLSKVGLSDETITGIITIQAEITLRRSEYTMLPTHIIKGEQLQQLLLSALRESIFPKSTTDEANNSKKFSNF